MKRLYESLLDDEDVVIDKLDTKLLIEEWLKKYSIENYKINKDDTIDVKGDVCLYRYPESKLPSYIQFRNIVGGFFIRDGKLKTLKGCPKEVSQHFYCGYCNSLKTLEGAPKEVGGSFAVYNCPSLKSLEGAPEKVNDNFSAYNCPSLKSLEGAPEKVNGSFICSNTKLTSLKGAPEKIGGYFECNSCHSLKSLEGCPKEVGKYFNCRNCGKEFTKEEVLSLCNCKGEIIV